MTLTDRQKRVYELKMGGMSWNDICRLLGITKTTAREHFRRACEKLDDRETA